MRFKDASRMTSDQRNSAPGALNLSWLAGMARRSPITLPGDCGNGAARRAPRSAFTLIECIVYMAVLGFVLSLAMGCFMKCLEYSRDLRRNADDVARVLKAGERWREDIRAARSVVSANEGGVESLRLALADSVVLYTLAGGKVWRDDGGRGGRQVFLAGVEQSEMLADRRERVAAWRWEVELQPRKSATRVRPLFAFTAVQDAEVKP